MLMKIVLANGQTLSAPYEYESSVEAWLSGLRELEVLSMRRRAFLLLAAILLNLSPLFLASSGGGTPVA